MSKPDPEPGYEITAHTADAGIRAYGASLAEVFSRAAQALVGLVVDLKTVAAEESREVEVEAADKESLLVAWLNELLYLLEADSFLSRDFEFIELTETKIRAKVKGEQLKQPKHTIKSQVKACSYHHLEIKKTNRGWEAQVTLDL